MAREAKLIYLGMLGSTYTEAAANAITVAMNRNVDILFSAWFAYGGGAQCNAKAILDVEQEAENAFDDGIFVTFLTGNEPATNGICDMLSPADIPKVFAVAGYNSANATCASNPSSGCFLEPYSYKNGGGNAITADGFVHNRALSMVDAVAPTNVKSMTYVSGDYGEVTNKTENGSSLAVPHVAGLAALVKDQYLSLGWDWINNPGRLHGVMLGMTDRHYNAGGTTTTQLSRGANREYGLGKAKLRLLTNAGGLGAWGSWHGTYTFNSTGTTSTYLWSGPMPVGTKILKCVLLQVEDMSPPKERISDIDLRATTRLPVNGSCTTPGAIVSSELDMSYDTKSMVALEQGPAALENRCAYLDMIRSQVYQSITAQVFCYYAGVSDDQP